MYYIYGVAMCKTTLFINASDQVPVFVVKLYVKFAEKKS